MGSVAKTQQMNNAQTCLTQCEDVLNKLQQARQNMTSQNNNSSQAIGNAMLGQNGQGGTNAMSNLLNGTSGMGGCGGCGGGGDAAVSQIAQQLSSGTLNDENSIQTAQNTVQTKQKSYADEVSSLKEGLKADQEREKVSYA